MSFQDLISKVVTLILVVGLFMVGIGIALWVFQILQSYNVSWQIQLAAFGLILLIFGCIAIKLFRD